ncbi:MAG: DNA-3-methyladenine glycosylase 2 family protein [Actinomycetota bacterium]
MEPSRHRALAVGDIDLPNTLQPIGIYGLDPTHRSGPGTFAKAVLTPEGPGTMRLSWDSSGHVAAEAWGRGADWLLGTAERWTGLADDLTGFDPTIHPKVERWWRDHGSFRMSSLGVIWQELALVLLGQRVTTDEASRSWNRMCRTWGQPAPGPCELWLPPEPAVIAGLTYRELHRVNVERRRAEAILLAARRANRLEEAATMSTADAAQRLTALPGLGVWTATSTLISSHGDPDVIMLRDYGMPTKVNYAFTGDATRLDPDAGGDEIMCRHLEPWAGHRQRIVRLLFAARIDPPRRGPKAFNPDIRRL